MAKHDITTIEYFKNPDRFADFFNMVLYHGEEVLHGSQLTAIDSQYSHTVKTKSGKNSRLNIKRYRDLINTVCAMESPESVLAILALEPFEYVDYGYPIRAMLYDTLEYDRQLKTLILHNRSDSTISLKKGGEQLTGLKKGDKIKPVITVALYLSPDPWDGPRSLHDILDISDPDLTSFIPDYKPIIISAEGLPPEMIQTLKTGVRQLLKAVKYCGSSSDITSHIISDQDFSDCDEDTIHTINVITGLNIEKSTVEKEAAMFKGVEEFYAEAEFGRKAKEIIAKKDAAIAKKDKSLAKKDASLAQKDASLAQKDASLAQKDEIIAKLITQISNAGMTPVVKV